MSIEKGINFNQEKREQLDKIIKKAETHDVTYDLYRYFPERMKQQDPELLEIQKQGFKSEAISWLRSTTPENIKYGTASKEERLGKVREFAEKAQTTIEELAKQSGINLSE
jgi:exopolysaccharide biosynthesis protein